MLASGGGHEGRDTRCAHADQHVVVHPGQLRGLREASRGVRRTVGGIDDGAGRVPGAEGSDIHGGPAGEDYTYWGILGIMLILGVGLALTIPVKADRTTLDHMEG